MCDVVFEEPLILHNILRHLANRDIANLQLAWRGEQRFSDVTGKSLGQRKHAKFHETTKRLIQAFDESVETVFFKCWHMNNLYDYLSSNKWFLHDPRYREFTESVSLKLQEQIRENPAGYGRFAKCYYKLIFSQTFAD
jgi:hypothetical protein